MQPEELSKGPTPVPDVLRLSSTGEHWKFLANRFLACNPFYLASAAMLLYSIYRISLDSDFMKEHLIQLSVNFGSLHFYEILLVVTAVFLAKRRIWYDSTLLVGLENMFVLLPFILVSQAVFMGKGATWFICLAGGFLALGKFWGLKRTFPLLNLPGRLLGIGAMVLLANIGLPLFFKHIHETDFKALERYSLYCWFALLPILQGCANLLQKPKRWAELIPTRSWLPFGILTLWISVTSVHLWCIGYVYDLPWHFQLIAPAAWVLTWTLSYRATDFWEKPDDRFKQGLLLLPCLAPLLAISTETSVIFFGLATLNTILFSIRLVLDRSNKWAFHLTIISFAAMIASMPQTIGTMLWPTFDRQTGLMLSRGLYFVVITFCSDLPAVGLGGSIFIVMATQTIFADSNLCNACTVQNAMVFLLLHSLRWKEKGRQSENLLRLAAATVWVVHSIAWVHSAGAIAMQTTAAYATITLAVYFAARLITGRWGAKIIPVSALLVLMAPAIHGLTIKAKRVPFALVVMAVSYLLFALGTWLALNKKRWIHGLRENDPMH